MPIIINTRRKIKVCGQHYNAKDKRVDFDLTFNSMILHRVPTSNNFFDNQLLFVAFQIMENW